LLDTYPGASAAFSLRKLKADYLGPAIKVRRNCDDATLDIGFDANGDLDALALNTFIEECPDPAYQLPLDIDNSATLAYGTRKLSSSYNGAAFRIAREDNDQATDIGFLDNGVVDRTAITAHCTSPNTDCFVDIWYDQSGNGNDALPLSDNTRAKIFDDNGGINTDEDNKLAIETDGYYDIYLTNVAIGNEHSVFATLTSLRQSPRDWSPDGSSSLRPFLANDAPLIADSWSVGTYSEDDTRFEARQNDWEAKITINNSVNNFEKLHFSVISQGTGGNLLFYKNNNLLGSDNVLHNGDFGNLCLFGQAVISSYERRSAVKCNEIIFYNNDVGANRNAIDTAIADYHGNDGNLGYVDTWYDQTGNANHAVQANTGLQALIYSEYEGGILKDNNGFYAVRSDGVNDIYPTGLDLDESHSVFVMISALTQTAGGSSFRPFIANSTAAIDFNKYLGYGSGSLEPGSKAKYKFLVSGNTRRYEPGVATWQKNQPSLFSFLSDENRMVAFIDDTEIVTMNAFTNNNYDGINLFGELSSGSRRFAGLANEFIIYDTDLASNRQNIQNNLAAYYGTYPVSFNGEIFLEYDTVYANSPIGTLISRVYAKNHDDLNVDLDLELVDNANGNLVLKNDTLFVNKNFFNDQNVTFRAINPLDSTHIDRDFTLKVSNSPNNNDRNDLVDENDEPDDVNKVDKYYPKLIDQNANLVVDFNELVDVIASINKLTKIHRKANMLEKKSDRDNIEFLIKRLDLNSDNEFTSQDILDIKSYIEDHEHYDYVVNLLAEFGTNKRGQVTFKKARKISKSFKRTKNRYRTTKNPRIKLLELVNLFDFNKNGSLDAEDREALDYLLQVSLKKENSQNSEKRLQRINRFSKKQFKQSGL
jgi:hypothetical protein